MKRFLGFGLFLLSGLTGCGGKSAPAAMSDMLSQQNAERAAVGVAPMQWSDDLAGQAQSYANQCRFTHSQGSTGENLYVDSNTAESAKDAGAAAVSAWATEKSDFNAQTNACAGQVCGHYTQMVWSTTTSVGCAVASCPGGVESFGSPGTLVVCEYSPAGNIVGVAPF